jgi:hypothetical protein
MFAFPHRMVEPQSFHGFGSWRTNAQRVSHPHEPGDPLVSNVLNPDG